MMPIAFPIIQAEIDTLAALLAETRNERNARQRAWEESQRIVTQLRRKLAAVRQVLIQCQNAVVPDE